jgi:predicted CxxxxCH...CXXCH cytochrome family protein
MNMLRSMKIFGIFWLFSSVMICFLAERAEAQLHCYDCHGTRITGDCRPLDAPNRDVNSGGYVGNHRSHLPEGAKEASCTICHHAPNAVPALYSSHHRDGKIQLEENINNSPHPDKAAYYKNDNKAVFFNQTSVPQLGSCRNVNCHFESPTQLWGSDTLTRDACTGCHGAPPSYGAHVKHSALLGTGTTSCSRCHTDHPSEADPLAHARQAGSRPLYIQFSGAANRSGVYAAGAETNYPNYLPSQLPTRNGSCTNLYCHSSGKAAAPQPPAPTWGGPPLGCNGCHGTGTATGAPDYANGGEGAALANSHGKHAAIGTDCAICHSGTTVSGSSIVSGSSLHINSQLDLTFNATAGTSAIWEPAAKTCSNTLCHTTAVPVWGGSLPADCTGCHGGNAASASAIATGRHTAHMNNYSTLGQGNNLGCAECHARTVDSDRHLSNQLNHFNKLKDYSGAKAGRIATAGSGRCTNAYCHSIGTKENQYWNMSSATWYSGTNLSCTGCHGTLTLPDETFQAYTSVAGEPNYPNTGAGTARANSHQKHVVGIQSDTTGCSRCHRSTVDAAIPNKLRDYSTAHLDRSRSVRFAAAIQGRYSATSQQCLNLYCHSNGEPFDNSTTVYRTANWGDSSTNCGSCHGDIAGAGTLSGRHGKHTASTIYISTCDRCHYDTLDSSGKIIDKSRHGNRSKDIAFREGGSYNTATRGCGSTTYCHSDAASSSPPWGAAATDVKWSDKANSMQCYSCHKGRLSDETEDACNAINGAWSSAKMYCTPSVTMSSNGHSRLAGPRWIRKYPCSYCHNATVDASGAIADKTRHMNSTKDVVFSEQWAIVGSQAPRYVRATKTCDNIYCHSDGTTDPEEVKPFPWTRGKTSCNTCHGHPLEDCVSCHDGETHIDDGLFWPLKTGWPTGQEWKAAIPMFRNQGPGTARANSHPRHAETDFTCDNCHAVTIKQSNGSTSCYGSGCHLANQPIPSGSMSEAPHLNAAYHVNKTKDVVLKDGGSYNQATKSCSNSKCHTGGADPVWGDTVRGQVICLNCHGTTGADVDDFGTIFNGTQAKINLTEWVIAGHGRYSSSGRYPSGNPAANFPGNPCWYCHDNGVLHNYTSNPFRLRHHNQFEQRFEKECVYCHMEGTADASECMGCHVAQTESLAPQATASGIVFRLTSTATETRYPSHRYTANCINGVDGAITCHTSDSGTFLSGAHKGHNSGAGIWDASKKADVKNQYLMMGVCLKCHDDDSGGKCVQCHTAPTDKPFKYSLGFDPGTGMIKPKKARASSVHFGYKHYKAYQQNGTWKGGKFCWDCHDPHGDKDPTSPVGATRYNLYMIQGKVALTTDGLHGKPLTRAEVSFYRKQSGLDYARTAAPYNGICNVCHTSGSQHFRSDGGDNHNISRVCTVCHEHRFTDSHADKQPCNSCHRNKPVPRHSGFGLPRDCTKCHGGIIGLRTDVMGQFAGTSHHIQGVDVSNKQCYVCHWESTPDGIIELKHHEGYNYKTYSTVKNAKVDLVAWGQGVRPTFYSTTSVVTFVASRLTGDNATARAEAAKLNNHCISCHSDQNNTTQPFGDCRTPSQYAWDRQSVAARYKQTGTASWGKYGSNGKSGVVKALSAHGNATANAGGFSTTTGIDSAITNTRPGTNNVTCFDCHNSHGSRVVGVTTSYVTFNGTKNGGNLKETQAGKGGYTMSYKATGNSAGGAVNPYSAGAGQCFDCHLSQNSGATPWGYQSTFGATSPIKGYMDTDRFGTGSPGQFSRYPYKTKSIKGGHFKASAFLNKSTALQDRIDGLCTPCHDPHGVSPTLGNKQGYGVPLLKGTWLSSPTKEDAADPYPTRHAIPGRYGDRHPVSTPAPTLFTTGTSISEDESTFAGLCLRCHAKEKLTDGTTHTWKSKDRVHESVKGWKSANTTIKHSFSCSSCHTPHVTSLPRLMQTNCLDYRHLGRISGPYTGAVWGSGSDIGGWGGGGIPLGGGQSIGFRPCHPDGYLGTRWNNVTVW